MTAHTLQVTLGSAATQISPGAGFVRLVVFQNNAGHVMRIGDLNASSARGAQLAAGSPGGSLTIGPTFDSSIDLSSFYVAGTSGDVLDVLYLD